MARKRRVEAKSSMYHVILRGNNKQCIFEEEADKSYFVKLLRKYKTECEFKLMGLVNMGNHVHLMVKNGLKSLSKTFQKICTAYAIYFNMKYVRTGSVFQDRFFSDPIEDDDHLLTCLRYIHNNPVKAGICAASEYEHSSFKYYASLSVENDSLIDVDIVLDAIKNHKPRFAFRNLISIEKGLWDSNNISDIAEGRRFSGIIDEQAKVIISDVCGCRNSSEFQRLGKNERDIAIRDLILKGLALKQISRLTGISYGVILRVKIRNGIECIKRETADILKRSLIK